MKFTDLRHIQQLNVLVDLAGLVPPLTPGAEPDEELAGTGLTVPIEDTLLFNYVNCRLVNTDDSVSSLPAEPNVITFSNVGEPDRTVLSCHMLHDRKITDNLETDRWGLISTLILKGDLNKGLIDAVNFLTPLENNLPNTVRISSTLNKLVEQFPKVLEIDESHWDKYLYSSAVEKVLDKIAYTMSNILDRVTFNHEYCMGRNKPVLYEIYVDEEKHNTVFNVWSYGYVFGTTEYLSLHLPYRRDKIRVYHHTKDHVETLVFETVPDVLGEWDTVTEIMRNVIKDGVAEHELSKTLGPSLDGVLSVYDEAVWQISKANEEEERYKDFITSKS